MNSQEDALNQVPKLRLGKSEDAKPASPPPPALHLPTIAPAPVEAAPPTPPFPATAPAPVEAVPPALHLPVPAPASAGPLLSQAPKAVPPPSPVAMPLVPPPLPPPLPASAASRSTPALAGAAGPGATLRPAKSRRVAVVASFAILVFLLLGTGGFFFWAFFGDNTPPPSAAAEPERPARSERAASRPAAPTAEPADAARVDTTQPPPVSTEDPFQIGRLADVPSNGSGAPPPLASGAALLSTEGSRPTVSLTSVRGPKTPEPHPDLLLALERFHISGIRPAGNDSRAMINGTIYSIGEEVAGTELRFMSTSTHQLVFQDSRGAVYRRNF